MTGSLNKIESKILNIRGQRVLLDSHLAQLYGVSTRTFNQAIKRNLKRFPIGFMFQLNKEEIENLRSQFVISSSYGGRRYLPYAFTEHGTVMAASILNSSTAVEVSIFVVNAFIKLRGLASHHNII